MTYCKVIVCGNVGKVPEARYLPSGDAVASFSLATSEKWTKDGKKHEKTSWHAIEAFGRTAEVVRDYVSKGSRVLVEGTLDYQEWETKEGEKKTRTKIKAQRLVLLSGKREETHDSPGDSHAGAFDDSDSVPF